MRVMKKTSTSQPRDALTSWDYEDKGDFRQWLRESLDLGARSSSDVCSRLKRLSGLCDIGLLKSEEDVQLLFASRAVIGDNTRTDVRSQMKRAAKLYLQFRKSKRRKQPR